MSDLLEDAYSILNLYPDCTLNEAREAYKQAALKHHPDRQPEHRKDEAGRRFKIYANAYLQICKDLGHEVEDQELAAPKTIKGLQDTPGALALRQAGRQASLNPPSPAGSNQSASPKLQVQRTSPRGLPQEEAYGYDEPAYEGAVDHYGGPQEYVEPPYDEYDETVDGDGVEEEEYYQPPPPQRQPPARRYPPQQRQQPQPRQMNGYQRAISARQGGPRGGPFDGFGGNDGFMDGFDSMDRDMGFGSGFGAGGGRRDMMPFSDGAGGFFGGGGMAAPDPFDQITSHMTGMMGSLNVRDPSFARDGGGMMQMRSRKVTLHENPDGSWSGQTQSKSMRAGDGRIDMQDNAHELHMPGSRGQAQARRGMGPRVADARRAKSARPQEMWEEPPPQYTDDRFQEMAQDDYLEGGDAYDEEYDDPSGFAPEEDYGPPVAAAPVRGAPAGRAAVPRIAPAATGAMVRRPAGPGAPQRGGQPPQGPQRRAIQGAAPVGPGALVRSGGGPGGQVAVRGQAPPNPMTKTVVPRSGAAAGQMVRRPAAGQMVAGRR